ncbi:MAG: 1-acyl-sn-glycerol-3-phosphate acyltransferase [Prevotellaceae bacterium]|jgi:1-acyl-sn-glycerol-3-phosphate acyltransferase|nr:1-acyl-sn-glycerol-3-phosphate acyltransferase [Prevotellaceae bacterium]
MLILLYYTYIIVIALPILIVATILAAVFTIILSPVFPNKQFSYYPARWWGRLFCHICLIRVAIEGLENIVKNRSYIITCNHQSIFDVFVVYGWLPSVFKWMMKADLRKIPLVGKACEVAGHIFISRESRKATVTSLEKAYRQLQNGISVVIFPEGTRTHTGRMGAFKRGAFLLATELKLPVLPITLSGSFERLPRNTLKLRPGKINMHIHPAIEVEPFLPDKTKEFAQYTHDVIRRKLHLENTTTT